MKRPGTHRRTPEYKTAGSLLFFDQGLIDRLSVAIYTCDDQGRITLFNKAAVKLWGREPKLGVDMWCGSWRIFHPDGTPLEPDACPMAVALKEGHSVIGHEILIERPDGTRKLVRPHPSPILDGAGKVIGAVNLLIEVSEAPAKTPATGTSMPHAGGEAQGEGQHAPQELAHQAQEDFLAILSHELRTPLTPALITLEGMEVDPMLPEGLRRNIAMVRRNVELEAKIIDDLLDLGRLARKELVLFIEPVALNETLRDVCDICRPQILEKELRLELRLDPSAGCVLADSARLQQVIWSLLKNAVKFTPPKGTVSVRTFRSRPDEAGFEIRDTSGTLPPDARRQLFSPFSVQQAGAARPFADRLGLAVAKSLIEQQSGRMTTGGGTVSGTVFIVELHGAPPHPTALPTAEQHASARKHLLLVEDHGDTATALARYLELSGFVVRSVPGFVEAMAQLEQESFDLIISDIGLGEMSGLNLMREIHLRWNAPGIAISGYGSECDILLSHEAGFSDHLVKPLKIQHLLEVVNRLLATGATPAASLELEHKSAGTAFAS